ncbi:MAG: LacI family DNA-binding transcriptional regulator [Acidimicrobiia bacterium]
MPTRSTSEDVARAAGVSRATVSYVLNGRTDVSITEATRVRVQQAVADLDYHPNASARQLAGARSQTIALIFRTSSVHLAVEGPTAQFLEGLRAMIRSADYQLLVEALSPGDRSYDNLYGSGRVDGVIISGPAVEEAAVSRMSEGGAPIVIHGGVVDPLVPSVDVDNVAAAREAVNFLVELGHRRIGCITHAPLTYIAAVDRLWGYRQAMAEVGAAHDDRLVVEGNFEASSGFDAATLLLQRRPELTAIFVCNDALAIGAISAIRAAGRRVPDDVSVVGFDDSALAQYFDPPLTTVRLPAFELGRICGSVLLDRIAGKPVPARTLLPTELIVRQSCISPDV